MQKIKMQTPVFFLLRRCFLFCFGGAAPQKSVPRFSFQLRFIDKYTG